MSNEELFKSIKKAVIDMNVEQGKKLAKRSLKLNVDPNNTIEKGFVAGIEVLGERWEKGEAFIPEIIQAAEVVHSGLQVLKSSRAKETLKPVGKVVIGTVEGDIHDIGKSLVAIMLEAAGFEIHDLGTDIAIDKFIQKAMSVKANLICTSALLTTTMVGQKTLINKLIEKKIRGKFKIMVGGAPVNQTWADEIGADGYASNAIEAVKVAKTLVSA